MKKLCGNKKLFRCQCGNNRWTTWNIQRENGVSDEELAKALQKGIMDRFTCSKKFCVRPEPKIPLIEKKPRSEPIQIPVPPKSVEPEPETNTIPVLKSSEDEVKETEEPAYDPDKEDELGDDIGDCISKKIERMRNKKNNGDKNAEEKIEIGSFFNNFLDNKFNNLEHRMECLKQRNTDYIANIQRKQAEKQARKAGKTIDRTAYNAPRAHLGKLGYSFNPLKNQAKLRKVENRFDELREADCEESPEDIYFNNRINKDDCTFDDRIKNRFNEKVKNEHDRFNSRFCDPKRYKYRDDESSSGSGKCFDIKSDGNDFIVNQMDKIKNTNNGFLSKINNECGGSSTIDSLR